MRLDGNAGVVGRGTGSVGDVSSIEAFCNQLRGRADGVLSATLLDTTTKPIVTWTKPSTRFTVQETLRGCAETPHEFLTRR